jgi:O-acetyl-ADP-ribose deacetylase (regulator of RNase III)
MKLRIVKGNILETAAEAIVCPTNRTLFPTKGLDLAIHKAAGPELFNEMNTMRKEHFPNGLSSGSVVATKAYMLPAKFILHTVAPVYKLEDISLLKKCYDNCLKLADAKEAKSISFPAISASDFGVPMEKSAQIVKAALQDFKGEKVEEVILVMTRESDLRVYAEILKELATTDYTGPIV